MSPEIGTEERCWGVGLRFRVVMIMIEVLQCDARISSAEMSFDYESGAVSLSCGILSRPVRKPGAVKPVGSATGCDGKRRHVLYFPMCN